MKADRHTAVRGHRTGFNNLPIILHSSMAGNVKKVWLFVLMTERFLYFRGYVTGTYTRYVNLAGTSYGDVHII